MVCDMIFICLQLCFGIHVIGCTPLLLLHYLIEKTGDSTHRRTCRWGWGLQHLPSPALPNFAQLRFLGQQDKFRQTKFLQKFPYFVSVTASHLLTLKGHMPTLQSAMDRIIDIFGRRNGRDSFIFLLTCVMGSYDRLIGKNIFISFVGLCQFIV